MAWETIISIGGECDRRLADEAGLLDAAAALSDYFNARNWTAGNNLGQANHQSWDVYNRDGEPIGIARITNLEVYPRSTELDDHRSRLYVALDAMLDNNMCNEAEYERLCQAVQTLAPTPPADEASVRRLSAEQYDTLSEASDRLDELGYGILGEAVTAIADEFGPYS